MCTQLLVIKQFKIITFHRASQVQKDHMVPLVHLVRRAILALLEKLEMMAIQVDLVMMERREHVIMHQASQFHLVIMETQENQ